MIAVVLFSLIMQSRSLEESPNKRLSLFSSWSSWYDCVHPAQAPLTGVHMRHATSALACSSAVYHCKRTRNVYCTALARAHGCPLCLYVYEIGKSVYASSCRLHRAERRLATLISVMPGYGLVQRDSSASSWFNEHISRARFSIPHKLLF